MKRIFTTLAVAAMVISSASAENLDSYTWSPCDPSTGTNKFGYQLKDTYNIGVRVANTRLAAAGAKMTKVSFAVNPDSQVGDYVIWLASKLSNTSTGTNFVGDVFSQEVTPQEDSDSPTGYSISVTFDEPREYGNTGIYVGYNCTVKGLTNNFNKYPIVGYLDGCAQSFYWRLQHGSAANSNSETKWMDMNNYYGVSPVVKVFFTGSFPVNEVQPSAEECYGQNDEGGEMKLTFTNIGFNAVESLEYTYTVETDGKMVDYPGKFTGKINSLPGSTAQTVAYMPMESEAGVYPVKVKINKINGEEVDYEGNSCETTYTTVVQKPKHNVVVEEFTGTTCPYCTRGFAGLEMVTDKEPDAVVIAYHTYSTADPMYLGKDKAPYCPSYPKAVLDRTSWLDPYFGTYGSGLILSDIRLQAQEFAFADLDVKGQFNEDKTSIKIKSTTNFHVVPNPDYNYRIAYVVVADGLKGDSQSWYQKNAYSGWSDYAGYDYLKNYVNGPATLTDFEFNDVAIFSSGLTGVANSIPTDIVPFTPYEHEYEVRLANCVNANGESLVQDLSKLRVAALLIKSSGSDSTVVLNGAQDRFGSASVNEVAAAAEMAGVEYYTLDGIRTVAPQKGIFVKVTRLADGSSKTEKVVLK